jgi:hypothetical protein
MLIVSSWDVRYSNLHRLCRNRESTWYSTAVTQALHFILAINFQRPHVELYKTTLLSAGKYGCETLPLKYFPTYKLQLFDTMQHLQLTQRHQHEYESMVSHRLLECN